MNIFKDSGFHTANNVPGHFLTCQAICYQYRKNCLQSEFWVSMLYRSDISVVSTVMEVISSCDVNSVRF